MRIALPAALIAVVVPSPALATVGLLCTSASGKSPAVSVVFGAYGGIGAVNLKEGASWRSSWNKQDGLLLTRSLSDRRRVQADFRDTREPNRFGQLRVRISGHTASGTLTFGGRSWAVRCIQD